MKRFFISISLILFAFMLFSQNKTVLEINEKKIGVDEFLYFYNKNNKENDAITYKNLKDYMESFLNFKLKVYEAEDLKLDTSKNFTNELNGYRSKLAQPYLTDKKSEEEILKEYYDRMRYDVDVSHILIKIKKEGLEEDTLSAYKKISDIYKRLQKGENFEKLAVENSEDESVAKNKGHLGYYTIDNFLYEFENEMYNTPVGQFSKPFRTIYGYHILIVHDKRLSNGQYKVAHIMRGFPKELANKSRQEGVEKFLELYEQIKKGEILFDDAVKKYSDDRKTAENNGEIGWISVGGKYIKEFENAVFSLKKIGDLTILETNYGMHIIKLIDIEPIKPFEEIERDLKAKLQNTQRTLKSRTIVLDNLKKEYKLNVIRENIVPIYDVITDSLFAGTLVVDNIDSYKKPLITFSDQTFTQKDYIQYLLKYNRKQTAQIVKTFVDSKIDNYIDKVIIEYEETQLAKKYPEFNFIVGEYHDGILLFQVSDSRVWGKAVKDTLGLEKFYNENKYNYMWNYRYSIKTYEYKDAKTAKSIEKLLKKNSSNANILKNLNKKDSTAVKIGTEYLSEKNKELFVDNVIADNKIPEQDGFVKIINNIEDKLIIIVKVIGPTPKTIPEARGTITSDYQKVLEENWLKELKSKYKIVVHDDILKSISTK